jgi:GTP pyrophosphokinase
MNRRTEKLIHTPEELQALMALRHQVFNSIASSLHEGDLEKLEQYCEDADNSGMLQRDVFGLSPMLTGLQTAQIAIEEIGVKRDGVIAIILYKALMAFEGNKTGDNTENDSTTIINKVKGNFGDGVATIVHGLLRVQELYRNTPVVESENFRNLLLSFADDMRVILIMIAERVNMMRQIRDVMAEGQGANIPSDQYEAGMKMSEEASYLYAPLAHKLGLYKLKSELEDLSLKYLEHDAYYMIKEKLNATKRSRDAYIKDFIGPIDEKLRAAGLHFHMKGRTKSIHSIWQKMKKQKCGFEGIYDLFAIRIIIDTPEDYATLDDKALKALKEREKMQCWQTFSIITDMYQPNPKRMRDWLSVPKSNGYESLHITVLGPQQKWVEVQIRTERMDDVAEHGLAAHWRYKGIKGGENGVEDWLASIRTALEAGDDLQVMDQFRIGLYDDEVYVFTPKGDLLKFPKGATILDFAYHIHSKIGNKCVGGKINGKNVTFRQQLQSGDTVEVLTSNNQQPKREWLNIVKSSRAKAKIRQALKETQVKDGLFAKELLERRFKNRKMEIDESSMMHLVRKMGFKEVSDFYKQIADGKLDANDIIEQYIEVRNHDLGLSATKPAQSAEEFEYENPDEQIGRKGNDDVLVIDRNLKGIDFTLAKCCHPIYGDPVFGFVTVNGGIKIHREDCPNAHDLRSRFGYRIVKARWSGKGASQYAITLRVIGNDDIGIVSNISNIISKDEKLIMRSINIDSHDGLFSGNIVVQLDDTNKLEALIKKLRTVKGVKQVTRL